MKKITLLLIFVSSCLMASLNAQTKGHNKTEVKFVPTDPKVTIKFKSVVIDYGKIAHYSNGTKEFYFTNTGTKPLIITSVQGSCGCTVPTWPKQSIKPGATNKIIVKYATDRVGKFEKSVTVFSNASNGSVVLTIKGDVSALPKTLPSGVEQFDPTK